MKIENFDTKFVIQKKENYRKKESMVWSLLLMVITGHWVAVALVILFIFDFWFLGFKFEFLRPRTTEWEAEANHCLILNIRTKASQRNTSHALQIPLPLKAQSHHQTRRSKGFLQMGIMAKPIAAHQQKLPSFSLLPSSFSDFNGARLHSQLQVPLFSLSIFCYGYPFFTLEFLLKLEIVGWTASLWDPQNQWKLIWVPPKMATAIPKFSFPSHLLDFICILSLNTNA